MRSIHCNPNDKTFIASIFIYELYTFFLSLYTDGLITVEHYLNLHAVLVGGLLSMLNNAKCINKIWFKYSLSDDCGCICDVR